MGGNIKFINLFSKTTRDQFVTSRNYTNGSTVTYMGQAIDKEIYTINNSLIGENNLGALKINWALSHAYTKGETPFDHSLRFYENTSSTSGMKNISDPHVLQMSGANLIPYAWNAFDKATLDRGFFHTEANDERNYDAKLDLEYPFSLSSDIAGIVKAGYKFRSKNRTRTMNDKESIYYLRGIYDYYKDEDGNIYEKDWAGSHWSDYPNLLLTDFISDPPETRMINDNYLLNPLIQEDLVRDWYDFNKSGTNNLNGVSNEYYNQLASVRGNYSVKERVHGTYAMVKLNVGRAITFIGGMRYEKEDNDYTGTFAPRIVGEFESQSGDISDSTSNYIKEYWFPNAHIKVSPVEWLDIRFAVSKSISRPDYMMRLPSLIISNQSQHIVSGNPNLEPAVSWNYDVSLSLYSSQNGLLTITGFRKNIDNIFYWLNDIKLMNKNMALERGLPVDEYGPFNQYTLDMPVNTQGTKVWGFEVDLQTHMSFLPGLLKNIVISANYSRIWSKTKYPRFKLIQSDVFPPQPPTVSFYENERELTGQTDYTANVSVGYDYMGFSGRLSGYFQGPYLSEISNFELRDIYSKAFSRWDLALKQVFTDNITVFLNVNNLTNVIEGTYHSYGELSKARYLYGTTAELGIQIKY